MRREEKEEESRILRGAEYYIVECEVISTCCPPIEVEEGYRMYYVCLFF